VAAEAPQLVAPGVTARKFARELELWDANAETYRRRGWLMVGRGELWVDVAFTTKVTFLNQVADVVCATVRFEFSNYDLWPPSLTFINLTSTEPWMPPMRAFMETSEGPRDLIVNMHPDTELPFLCVPGTREYHSHPQHSGDDWLLHRGSGEGRLAPLCDLLWRTMAANVVGLQVIIQTQANAPPQIVAQLVQGEVAPPKVDG
jgi:hypothetical protein